jgi:hypothetical protein
MQEFALFAVLLKERPYKNPYIAPDLVRNFVEPAVARPVERRRPSYRFDPAGSAKPGSLPGSAAISGGTRSGTEVASVGQPQTISPQKSRLAVEGLQIGNDPERLPNHLWRGRTRRRRAPNRHGGIDRGFRLACHCAPTGHATKVATPRSHCRLPVRPSPPHRARFEPCIDRSSLRTFLRSTPPPITFQSSPEAFDTVGVQQPLPNGLKVWLLSTRRR